MNIENLLENINDSGIDEIKYIFDTLIEIDEVKNYNNKNIELTDEVLKDLKTILIKIVKLDNEFANKIQNIIKNDSEPAPAGDLITVGIVGIALAPLCILLTMHANQLRLENPDVNYTDCVDILKALSLNALYDKIFQ
jgi:hypothetical protein